MGDTSTRMFRIALVFVAALAAAAAQEPNCAEVGTGLYEYPDNCRKYYSCDVTGTLSLELCYDNWLFSAPKQYCDFPENVECGDRPLCDENDANCEEHHVTTYTPWSRAAASTAPAPTASDTLWSARRASRSTRTSTRDRAGAIGPTTTARTVTIPNVQPKIVEIKLVI